MTPESNALLYELNIDRNDRFSLLSKTACAFVFDIAYTVGPPEKLSWCLPCHSGGKHHNKYLGNNLRRLGLCVPKNVNNYPLNKRDFQLLRIKLAEYGVPDEFNFTKLSLLNNKHLADYHLTQTYVVQSTLRNLFSHKTILDLHIFRWF